MNSYMSIVEVNHIEIAICGSEHSNHRKFKLKFITLPHVIGHRVYNVQCSHMTSMSISSELLGKP